MKYSELLGAAAATLRDRDTGSEDIATVTAVRDDGAVNVLVRGGLLPAVPALASYTPRAKGDVVVVRRTRAGLYVVGKTGTAPVPVDAPPPVTPPATVTPTAGDAWLGGQRRDDVDYPIQGDWGGWGANTGAWFYGTALTTAMTAGTVASATVVLTRSGEQYGDFGDVPVHLWTHALASPPQATPGRLAGPWVVGSLQLGEKDTFDLPAACIASLQATGRGLLVYAGSVDYIRFAPAGASCGAVHIDYQ